LELTQLIKEKWQKIDDLYDGRETNETSRNKAYQIQLDNFTFLSIAAYVITWPCKHYYDPSISSEENEEILPSNNDETLFSLHEKIEHCPSVWLTEEE
jgi:hypothetical protein